MPEGPEVRLSSQYLDFILHKAVLKEVNVVGGKFEKTHPQGMKNLKLPMTFDKVTSKGKMLIFSFVGEKMRMFAGLGMTGQFLFEEQKHIGLEFVLENIPPFPNRMYYVDMRRFGNVYFSEDDLSAKLAPSILDEKDDTEFMRRANKTTTSRDIVSVLMDQNLVCSGIGNYLMAETLYAAKISPFRTFKSLSQEELKRVWANGHMIAHESLKYQGVTVADFVAPNGETGQYQHYLRVYSKKTSPLGEVVKADKGSHGRTVWWVPTAQK